MIIDLGKATEVTQNVSLIRFDPVSGQFNKDMS